MTKQYWFWLIVVSLLALVIERARPWRDQAPFGKREQWLQDVFWLAFNGHVFGVLAQPLFQWGAQHANRLWSLAFSASPEQQHLLGTLPFWVQLPLAMLVTDFVEWCVHNLLLHRVPFLWRIHRMHHSIHTMDWIGNFRFHWGEIVIYSAVRYFPVVLLGARWEVGLVGGVIATTIGHLNHANVKLSWGPLKYVLNSPRMHLWHHDAQPQKPAGVNFGIVFSIWDWLFGTAYLPDESPERIGYQGDENVSKGLLARFFLPFWDVRPSQAARESASGCVVPEPAEPRGPRP